MSTLSNWYASEDNQGYVSSRLLYLTIHDFVDTERNEHCALDILISRINNLAHMARRENLDEEEKLYSIVKP